MLTASSAELVAPARAYPGDSFQVTGYLQSQGLSGRTVAVELSVTSAEKGQGGSSAPSFQKTERVTLGGDSETIPIERAPADVVKLALKATQAVGDGLYGVDIKRVGDKPVVIEVNDNPNIDVGVEDAVLRDEIYNRVMEVFLDRIERSKAGISAT